MNRRDCDHYCAAAIRRAALPSTIQQLPDYRRGYADAQAQRRPG
ncbi:MAG: hypothetical protein WCC28_03490 [Mycobacterium sp.]